MSSVLFCLRMVSRSISVAVGSITSSWFLLVNSMSRVFRALVLLWVITSMSVLLRLICILSSPEADDVVEHLAC